MDVQERAKLIEAVALFVRGTRNCGLVKLFKLLYFLDMLHFREAGRKVTELDYTALPYGPVPLSFYRETRAPESDLASAIAFEFPPAADAEAEPQRTRISVRSQPESGYLTKRELRIVNELCEIFHDATADEMSAVSHERLGPWDMAWRGNGQKSGAAIDFMNALRVKIGSGKPLAKEALRERSAEYDEVRRVLT